jgi:hypothetical protein
MEQQNRFELIKNALEAHKAKNYKIMFFVPETGNIAGGSIYEIYHNARTLKENGYEVIMLTEKAEHNIADWIDDDMKILPHRAVDNSLTIKPEDYLIIPEYYANIMEQTKNFPCMRIVLCQSFDYSINALLPGMTWQSFGIRNVICTNDNLVKFFKDLFGEDMNYQKYNIGIPNYFTNSDKPKKPTISFLARNANDITKVVKMFYLKYPEFRWINFEDLRNHKREDFAKKLSESMISLWIDRVAGFGTFPVESMKCETIPVGLIPEITPEYVEDNTGMWTNDIYKLPELLNIIIKMWLEDSVPNEVFEKMKEVSSKYDFNKSKEEIMKCYEFFFALREMDFEKAMESEKINQEITFEKN